MSSKKFNLIGKLLFIFTLMALVGFVFLNRRYAMDQLIVWQYKPTSAVTQLAERAGIGGYGDFLYLASQPSIESASDFNKDCGTVETTTSILGCFSNYRLYIYDVNNNELDGIKEVTAAHEMLHAAYTRLSASEKENVNKLINTEYQKIKNDKSLSERVAFYNRTEPGQLMNELHSVIGTEVSDVSPELAQYYGKYFTDRSKVVALNTKYISVFKSLSDRASALSDQLAELSASLNGRISQYNVDFQNLKNDINAFNSNARSGEMTEAQFNAERAALTTRVNTLNADRESLNNDSASYNSLLSEYNSIVVSSKKLYDSIDSKKLAPAGSL